MYIVGSKGQKIYTKFLLSLHVFYINYNNKKKHFLCFFLLTKKNLAKYKNKQNVENKFSCFFIFALLMVVDGGYGWCYCCCIL